MLSVLQSTPAPFEHSLAVPEPAPATLEPAPTEPEVGTGREPALDALDDPEEIPVVDFAGFLDGSAKEEVAAALLDSFKRFGFVYLKNYGVPTEEVDEMFEWASSLPPAHSSKRTVRD